MPRATSLLPRLTVLALALMSGCAFPFFRSKDKSLEEMVTVEAMAEEGPKTPAVEPRPAVADQDKPLPPIARFFGGFFGRGKSKPQADPISTLPTIDEPQAESVAKTSHPKIEFNKTGDVGAGIVAPKAAEPTPAAAPQVSNLAEMPPRQAASEPKSAAKPQPTEIVKPHTVAQAPPEQSASQQKATIPNPSKQTFASQSTRSQSGSLTAALRNALDDATKDGLAQQTQERESQSVAAALSSASRFNAPSPTKSRVVELSSSPLGSQPVAPRSQPVPAIANPPAVAEKVIENPTTTSSQIVTAAQKSDSNPLREDATSHTRMIDLATQPLGAVTKKPQTVYPTQEAIPAAIPAAEPAAQPTDATTLVAFQSHVHSGDSIIDQLKQSRRVNQYRPMYETESVTAAAATKRSLAPTPAQAVTAAVRPAPDIEPIKPQPAHPTVVAAIPTPARQEVTASDRPSTPPASPTVIAARPTPVPVEIAAPTPTQQAPTDFAATIPLENPAATKPAMSNPEPIATPYRPEALSKLVPTEAPITAALLEQPGSQPAEPATAPTVDPPTPQLATTPTNPVRAIPRVAVAPQATSRSTTPSRPTPQVAARPTPTAVEPMVISTPRTSSPVVSPVATPQLAPVVTVEEYRRMQQQRRSQATRKY
ncbi:hypothetical protein M4951_11105 [Blastopirellula sp. J2-11]|uniref:hypothetical protein n=1 Tax=Blastopirellula sp. J2-11 TaxID=2943192 RepID=UPI0021CA858B|nr:hypothetical protein [Blastopirellula sp. J2-11]UUO08839.1 hypothetical protein M4951_11105 [Blastopirellula sp. J2-11]